MDQETARELIAARVREELGKVVELRGMRVHRQPAGRLWVGELVRVSRYGEVRLGEVGVTEDGHLTGFGADQLMDLLLRIEPLKSWTDLERDRPRGPRVRSLDLGSLLDVLDEAEDGRVSSDEDGRAGAFGVASEHQGARQTHGGPDPEQELDHVEAFFEGLDVEKVRQRISVHLFSGRRKDLLAARELLPLLLPEPEGRAEVLCRMAELELWLGDVDVGLGYLEAAGRELADRGDVAGLEQVAGRARKILGEQRARRHPISQLLEQTRDRLEPIAWLDQVPVFRGLRGDAAARVAALAREEMVAAGTFLIREDDPPAYAFAVKEGRLSVWVEGPVGAPRFIRCCFPGEFLGESTVLGGEGATCTATVRAEGPAVVWRLEGAALRRLAAELPELRRKIDSTGLRHRLDSFFTLSTGTGGLDARLRDRLLSCFSGLREVPEGQLVLAAGSVPGAVFLVADGELEARTSSGSRWRIGAGRFIGLRDALHELPCAAECVALGPSRLVSFDVGRLRTLAAEAPPEVIAVLDSLE